MLSDHVNVDRGRVGPLALLVGTAGRTRHDVQMGHRTSSCDTQAGEYAVADKTGGAVSCHGEALWEIMANASTSNWEVEQRMTSSRGSGTHLPQVLRDLPIIIREGK